MSPVRQTRRATYADLEALDEHLTGELIDGELIASPRPAPPHLRASSAIGGTIWGLFGGGPFGGPGGWRIYDEPEIWLEHPKDDPVVVPDVAGWRRERDPELPDVAHLVLAPDWVCEVLSPRNAKTDVAKKLPLYARYGVPFAWYVDPIAQTLEVMVLEREHWTIAAVHGGDVRVRAVPFAAVEIDLATWWLR